MGRARRRKKARLMYIKFFVFILLIILAINLIKATISKYRSSATSTANVDLAYYIFQAESISQDLKLESILPREQPYNYTFSVSNHDDTDRTETAIEYTIIIKTTTNLPLTYSVYNVEDLNTNLVTETNTTTDDDGTYYKITTVEGETLGFEEDEDVVYRLQILFPEQYNVSEYEGIIEYVQITINSSQIIV